MLLTLFTGLSRWIVYGIAVSDLIIIVANATGAALVGIVLACKIRDTLEAKRL
jgi:uncharacterized protein with PQ loop repeat